jgi:hypothetical protein
MIDLITENNNHFILVGTNTAKDEFQYKLPVTQEELAFFASHFYADKAKEIGENKAPEVTFGSFGLGKSMYFPAKTLKGNHRTRLSCGELKWHLLPHEIQTIGDTARKILAP